jgi:hypothetical protein
VHVGGFTVTAKRGQRHRMATFTQLDLTSSDPPEPFADRPRLAVAAYMARFKGCSRNHIESDLRCYLAWCADRAWMR